MNTLRLMIVALVLFCGVSSAQDRSAKQLGQVERYSITSFPLYGAVAAKSDTVDLTQPGFVRADAAGTVVVLCQGNIATITLTVIAGEYVPCLVKRVYSTGTSAITLHVFY